MYQKIKLKIFEIIEKDTKNNLISKIFDLFIMTLIIINILCVIMESISSIKEKYIIYFSFIESFSILVFTLEYILRIWTAEYKFPNKNKTISKLLYIFSFLALIDLIVILPFYLSNIIKIELRYLRIIRIFRLLRIFKLNRYIKSLNLFKEILKEKKEELIVSLIITLVLLFTASALMYSIENEIQPDKFPDILSSFWWGITTLTTVGYGDVYPKTILGKILSGIIALLGTGLVALPTGIISSGFIEKLSKQKKIGDYCRHCGKKL